MPHTADVELTAKRIAALATADDVAGFLTELGYPTGVRRPESPAAYGFTPELADAITRMELLAEDAEGFFRVLLFQFRSTTAKARNEIVRNLGRRGADHLLILTSDFGTLEFVVIDKVSKQRRGPGGGATVAPLPRSVTVERKSPGQVSLRILRRLTWTAKDGLAQYDKLRSVFQSAHYVEKYFTNLALFSDHYLEIRLREDTAWKESPNVAFDRTRTLMADAAGRFDGQTELKVRAGLYEPMWKLLGFQPKAGKDAKTDHPQPDYELRDADGNVLTAAFCYRWDRWLDGPDLNDPDTPDENPGAAVVSALANGGPRWIIVTNGRLWRLYSAEAHSRATNYYEVDLPEALAASGETDPAEAFRYWWLFFRAQAFVPDPAATQPTCWLDTVVRGSRDYAKKLGDRLKDRIFKTIFPHLAQGFLHDRRTRLKQSGPPSEEELRDTFEATLTLLYRLLFLLYAESRDLLPINESAYQHASLKQVKDAIADKAGRVEGQVADKLQAYGDGTNEIYAHLQRLFTAMDKGDQTLNVPTYNGGLFITEPRGDRTGGSQSGDGREQRIAEFLRDRKVPDRFLALAIDRLARDPDEKSDELVAIDYKSLEVRHLGSIYEGLLEFKLKIAAEDLGVTTEKKAEKYVPLDQVKTRGRKKAAPGAVVRKGEVYLSNDKSERKATGSYYTPDPIVEYIVEHTVGPVLEEKLKPLVDEFRAAGKTFRRHLENAKDPRVLPTGANPRDFAAQKTYAEHKDLVERVFDLKVLDPAMGSGHFLVEAVDFITDRLLDFLNRFPNNPVGFMLDRTRRSIEAALGEQGVTVNSDKLTDINLLKRHVLKRCIYGVDLNPMAVELAKVSLWLDVFTLGAPLSFLDHHLRCGNSLIGATFEDLKKATGTLERGIYREGQLFSIDYQPLLRAIQHVLLVNEMADATAAEVHQSQDEYAQARRELSGYQILLDLLVADHFVDGKQKPSDLLRQAADLDATTRETLMRSLRPADRATIGQVGSVSSRADLRFFHWEIEFPEVFFGFADADRRQIRHRNDITRGAAGFDAIMGNPPYVRQETLKQYKALFAAAYAPVFDAANDLFVYFMFREIDLLRAPKGDELAGLMGMIVANKWLRAGYGVRLRRYLGRAVRPVSIVDFGHSPVFPDADTFPCVPIFARRGEHLHGLGPVPDGEAMTACQFPREEYDPTLPITPNIRRRAVRVPTALLREDGWTLDDPREQMLLDKLRQMGSSLKEIVGDVPRRGIVSGLNEAFYIDAVIRDRLVAEEPRSAELIRPLIRGRHISRWVTRPTSDFILMVRRGTPITKYPAIRKHLLPFKDRLEPRPRDWDEKKSGKWPGRAAGDYEWFELQGSPGDEFVDLTSKPKIVYQEIQFHSWFALDTSGSCINNKAFLLPTDDLALLGVLSSPLMWWVFTRTLPHMKDEALSPSGQVMENLQFELGTGAQQRRLTDLVGRLIDQARAFQRFEAETVEAACERLGASGVDVRVLPWLALPPETFASRMRRLAASGSDRSQDRMVAFQREARTEQVRLLEAQRDLEQELARQVEDIYALVPEERALLRTTRPVRDPLDVLEGRIRGTSVADGVA